MASVYYPILTKLSVAVASPYAKADLAKRRFAAVVDGMLVATTLVVYSHSGSLLYVFAGAAYLLLRDSVTGRSVGKFFSGLVVIDLVTGRPCGQRASASRNVLFVLPGANIVAACLEAATIVTDPQGQRLGDRLASTQVVEGFGAKDVVAEAQRWWLDFLARLDGNPRSRERVPIREPGR